MKFPRMNAKTVLVQNGQYEISTTIHGEGPVILCVHGWPEHAHSWRHQIDYFVAKGYSMATMDVRGYNNSSKPKEIEAYSQKALASDVAAVARAISSEPITLFGHDWGANIAYAAALRHPDVIAAIAGLSSPYMPTAEVSLVDMAKQIYADRFFYIVYFQQPGLIEQEFEADTRTALRKIYHSLSGDAPDKDWLKVKPANAKLLDDMVLPDCYPEWMSEADLEVYLRAFEKSGFFGPVGPYRAMGLNTELDKEFIGTPIQQPAYFIGGEKDPIRHYFPDIDTYKLCGEAFNDFRGATIVPDAGHWIQQEAPEQTNEALARFVDSLS